MVEQVIATGVDTWVVQPTPNGTRGTNMYPIIQNSLRRTLVQMPIGLPSNVVVLSATLSCPARGAWAAQLVSVQALAAQWRAAKATWNNQPGVLGSAVSTSITAKNDGDWIDLDVTSLVQAVVNGQANWGWRISTDSTAQNSFYGFDSGHDSWTLTVEYSDTPTAPTQLVPQGVISLEKWMCQVNDVNDLASICVEVDAAANPGTAWSSGWVSTSQPVLDLATTAYSGLADGATTYWRVAVKTADGSPSEFSDWAEVTRAVKPTLTVDTPTGGTITSSTPLVTAHLTPAGDDDTRWRVRVLPATSSGKVLWDSGTDVDGATLSVQVPRMSGGKAVLAEDVAYRIEVSVLDRDDRVSSYGDPSWITTTETVMLDADGSQQVPEALAASQPTEGGPDVLLHFTRGVTPDEFEVLRDGKMLPYSIDPADALVSAGTWEWVDVTADPNAKHVYRVRAVTSGKASAWSASSTITPYVEGVWVRSGYGSVCLAGTDVDSLAQTDKRITYTLPYGYEDVDIVGAVAGFAGSFSGWIDEYFDNQSVDAARAILEQIRTHPSRPVQLVWGTHSIPVYLRGLSVATDPDMIPDRDRTHAVSFGCFQTDDASATGFGAAYYGVGVYA